MLTVRVLLGCIDRVPISQKNIAGREYLNPTCHRRRHHNATGRCRYALSYTIVFPRSSRQISTVPSLTVGPRVEEAMRRSVRWLDRCIQQHEKSGKTDVQNLFAIVQGGLDTYLRDQCLDEMIKRKDNVAGYAVGGLSGGEAKGNFVFQW